jgi:hypothetical protein
LICETLLTADSDRTRSLQAVDTAGMTEDNDVYVVDKDAHYALKPSDTQTPDNDKVLAATGGGNWVLAEGGSDPIEVRTLGDLPAPSAGIISLSGSTVYKFIGTVDLGTNRLSVAAGGAVLVGEAGSEILVNSALPAITGPSSGGAQRNLTLDHLTVTQSGSGVGLSYAPGATATLFMKDCTINTGAGHAAVLVGTSSCRAEPKDCVFNTSGGDAVQVSGSWGMLAFDNCWLGVANGIVINDLAAIAIMRVLGCTFLVGAPSTGIDDLKVAAGGAISTGALLGQSTFEGAGTAIGAKITSGNSWTIKHNVGPADDPP